MARSLPTARFCCLTHLLQPVGQLYCHRHDLFLEDFASVLIIGEHIKARACRGKQHVSALFRQLSARRQAEIKVVARHRIGRVAHTVERLLDLVRRVADEHAVLDQRRFRDAPGQRVKRHLLVAAAENEHRRLFHRRDGLLCGIDVRSLGIVDPCHAVQLPHRLDAVLHALEGFEHFAHRFAGNAHHAGDDHSGQRVFKVVRAGDIHLVAATHHLLALAKFQNDADDPRHTHRKAPSPCGRTMPPVPSTPSPSRGRSGRRN